MPRRRSPQTSLRSPSRSMRCAGERLELAFRPPRQYQDRAPGTPRDHPGHSPEQRGAARTVAAGSADQQVELLRGGHQELAWVLRGDIDVDLDPGVLAQELAHRLLDGMLVLAGLVEGR